MGWHLSRSGKASTASSALEQALIARFGTLGRAPQPLLLRSDNGLVFNSQDYTAFGEELRAAPGVHHAALSTTKRHGRACHPHAQGAMRSPVPVRDTAARQSCHR
ncbi:hypothetical protein [Delftia sp. K82]|uniref:hypothetical protein n=1 Tax=Delftia sp. K82 TaxID=1472718 RepID=UPI00211B447E|nr:hypothetical protein [Delftia sp. K82]